MASQVPLTRPTSVKDLASALMANNVQFQTPELQRSARRKSIST